MATEDDSVLIHVQGWIHRYRDQKRMKFIILRDGTEKIQCIIFKDLIKAFPDEIKKLRKETTVSIWGSLVESDKASSGLEIHCKHFEVIGEAAPIAALSADSSSHVRCYEQPKMNIKITYTTK